MKKQHGLTLVNLVLVLAVAGVILATTTPALLRVNTQVQQHVELQDAVNQTLRSLHLALSEHWQQTQCRTAPTVNVNQLINLYQLPSDIMLTLPLLNVNIDQSPNIPHLATRLTTTFDTESDMEANRISNGLKNRAVWVRATANRITVIEPISPIDSQFGRMNIDPTTGCY
ncbi:hypothetical protein L4D77_19315 [Photobacterium frigidiphilum]|uniref:hypothetical protein n=1 Tax=Photobacterium frigidiphilum TaxID=264736 RepID=UPI003D09BCA5